ncbi:MAG: F0F1 ATP synthase subunit epsilon [Planctomycetota bacterium]|nr:MAG: F0F1 ATP synthase subunit epsilon [Planctomycetota bacterium]
MKLKVLLPTHVFLDEEATRVVAEGLDGSFCLLPRHADFVSALAAGVLLYETPDRREHYVAVDRGILVKSADEVLVSTRRAVPCDDLGTLTDCVQESFREIDEREKMTNHALIKLEANIVRRFIETGLA